MAPEEARLDLAWQALEEGRARDALALVDALSKARGARTEDVEEGWVVAVHAWLALGERVRARGVLERLSDRWGERDDDVLWARAQLLLAEGSPREALACFEAVDGDDDLRADLHEEIALACDLAGDHARAARELRLAHRADPLRHAPPLALTPAEFDRVLDRAVRDLPEEFAEVLETVPVVVESMPSLALVKSGQPPDLLGLWDPGHEEAPSRILIFQRNLERAFPDKGALVREIRTTLYHELGHVLGFDEDGLEELGLD